MDQEKLEFKLRPASREDVDFIFRLRELTMKEYFEPTMGWEEGEQRIRAADGLDDAEIIFIEGEDIGVVKVLPEPEGLHLHQMQILPQYQGMGIGSAIIKRVLDKAGRQGLPVTLLVLKGSPAKRLYERFGFAVQEEREHNFKMQWFPNK